MFAIALGKSFSRLNKIVSYSKICGLYCGSSNQIDVRKRIIYNEALTVSNNDPEITVEDAINKGFAYLTFERDLFSWSALECFKKAQELDTTSKYKKQIECGIKQATNKNETKCHFVAKF